MNILVLEDDVFILMDLKLTLQRLGHNIGICTNYNEIIYQAKKIKPDLLLSDINLGKNQKTGIEVAKELQVIYEDLKVIYLTAYKVEDFIQDAVCTKPIGYLSKPISLKLLKDLLKKANPYTK